MISELEKYGKEFSSFATVALITSVLSSIIGFISLKIFTNYLSIEDYGVLSLSLSIIAFISSISSLGFQSSIVRYLIQYNEKNELLRRKNLTHTSIMMVFICSIFVTAFFLLLSFSRRFFIHPSYIWLIIIISIINIAAALYSIFLGIIRAFQKSKWYFVFITVNVFFGNLIGIALLFNLGIVGILLGSLIGILFALILFLSTFKEVIFGNFSLIELKRILKFGSPQILTSIIGTGYIFVIYYLLYTLANSEALAVFNVGRLIVTPFLMIETALTISYLPLIIKMWERGEVNILSVFVNKILNFFLIISTIILLGYYFFSTFFITVLTREEYLIANSIIIFLVFEGIFRALITINCFGASIKERKDLIAYVFVASRIISVMIAFFLIPFMNLIGAAIAIMVGSIAYFILTFLISYHFVKIEYDIAILSRHIIVLLPIFLLIILLKNQNYLISFGMITVVYISLTIALRVLKIEEIKEIFKLLF